jgi:D-alanyl-lipoteichoic acid acyltransferase DltB (MBOAT superfamily)
LTFYGFWRWEFLSIVLISTVLDYLVSLALGKTPDEEKLKRKGLLLISLITNLGLLVYFKYMFFIVDNLNSILSYASGAELSTTEIVLPLGISFYTFQTISYTIDVYRRHIKPEKDFMLYGCYVTFFPQLVAGPILRASEVMDQLSARPRFKLEFISEGLKRILKGLFLKVVLADNIAALVDVGFGLEVNTLGAMDVWTLAFLFGFQIYFDFAGYSHIAIGCAKLMGISFPENFNYPYAARSFKAFWKRWHISLSSWIRDYLYLPLASAKVVDKSLKSQGGIGTEHLSNKISKGKQNYALFMTWAIMGLWHGANWTFVLWGLFHAVLIFIERMLSPVRERSKVLSSSLVGWGFTIPIAMLGWIPFRASNVADSLSMFAKVLTPSSYAQMALRENSYLVAFILFAAVTMSYVYKAYLEEKINERPALRYTFNTVQFAVMFVLVFTFFRPISQFIYFQF